MAKSAHLRGEADGDCRAPQQLPGTPRHIEEPGRRTGSELGARGAIAGVRKWIDGVVFTYGRVKGGRKRICATSFHGPRRLCVEDQRGPISVVLFKSYEYLLPRRLPLIC